MDFPENRAIITKYGVGVLISDLDKNEIADHINLVLRDQKKYTSMKSACRTACDVYNWDHEEKKTGKTFGKSFGKDLAESGIKIKHVEILGL